MFCYWSTKNKRVSKKKKKYIYPHLHGVVSFLITARKQVEKQITSEITLRVKRILKSIADESSWISILLRQNVKEKR